MKKVVYIISDIDKALEFEQVVLYLNPQECSLSFILLNAKESKLQEYLHAHNIPCTYIPYHGKKGIINVFRQVYKALKKINPDVVHTHLWGANLIGLPAAYLLGIKQRVYTRHHSDFNHLYHPRAVWLDKLCNRLSTNIVAISSHVKDILVNREHVSPSKVSLIHHGIDVNSFGQKNKEAITELQTKYNPLSKSPVIGVISRYTHWKGIQYIIPAFQKLLIEYPDALLLLANASSGDYASEISTLLRELPSNNYCEIEFEYDQVSLYSLFNIFVHVPIDKHCEAFGQVYIEALAAGVPSILTVSGIANDLAKHKHNAYLVEYMNSDEILDGMLYLLTHPNEANQMAINGREDVKCYSVEDKITKLETLYRDK